ncbi:hypothetical protein PsYK624_032710 [Phanerochaete sordida]|uniref:Uncharacterized protein n=1 Tax=Phanerochaete sordida TaxID=48140 RepID=A0A9P3G2Q8_9APHY|nr:hypothetical protein PsYK624_032710 [Phanerochaete sordida]
MSWTSQFAGWHSRSHPDQRAFNPTRDELVFAVLRSTPAEPDGFTLALFTPNIAVDSMGRVLVLGQETFDGVASLAKQTLELPETGTFRNTWRIKQPRTSQPIERLLVPSSSGELRQICVQGYEKDKRELSAPVGDITELPEVLWELFGLFEESRGLDQRGRESTVAIDKVKAVLGEVS